MKKKKKTKIEKGGRCNWNVNLRRRERQTMGGGAEIGEEGMRSNQRFQVSCTSNNRYETIWNFYYVLFSFVFRNKTLACCLNIDLPTLCIL